MPSLERLLPTDRPKRLPTEFQIRTNEYVSEELESLVGSILSTFLRRLTFEQIIALEELETRGSLKDLMQTLDTFGDSGKDIKKFVAKELRAFFRPVGEIDPDDRLSRIRETIPKASYPLSFYIPRINQNLPADNPQEWLQKGEIPADEIGYRDNLRVEVVKADIETEVRQQANPEQVLTEIIDNSKDAMGLSQENIGRFGIGFLSSLAWLRTRQDHLKVLSQSTNGGLLGEVKSDGSEYYVKAEESNSFVNEAQAITKKFGDSFDSATGSLISLETKLSDREQQAFLDEIIYRYTCTTGATVKVNFNGQIREINGLNQLTDIYGNHQSHSDKIVYVVITENALQVLDSGEGIDPNIFYRKLLVPNESSKDEGFIQKEMLEVKPSKLLINTQTQPPTEQEMTGSTFNQSKPTLRLQMGGKNIEIIELPNQLGIPWESVLVLPTYLNLNESKTVVSKNEQFWASLNALVLEITNSSLSSRTKVEFLNLLTAYMQKVLSNAGGGSAESHQAKMSFQTTLQESTKTLCGELKTQGYTLYPNQPGYRYLATKPDKTVFIHPDIWPIREVIGSRAREWKSTGNGKIQEVRVVAFRPSNPDIYTDQVFFDGSTAYLDERIYAQNIGNEEGRAVLNLLVNPVDTGYKSPIELTSPSSERYGYFENLNKPKTEMTPSESEPVVAEPQETTQEPFKDQELSPEDETKLQAEIDTLRTWLENANNIIKKKENKELLLSDRINLELINLSHLYTATGMYIREDYGISKGLDQKMPYYIEVLETLQAIIEHFNQSFNSLSWKNIISIMENMTSYIKKSRDFQNWPTEYITTIFNILDKYNLEDEHIRITACFIFRMLQYDPVKNNTITQLNINRKIVEILSKPIFEQDKPDSTVKVNIYNICLNMVRDPKFDFDPIIVNWIMSQMDLPTSREAEVYKPKLDTITTLLLHKNFDTTNHELRERALQIIIQVPLSLVFPPELVDLHKILIKFPCLKSLQVLRRLKNISLQEVLYRVNKHWQKEPIDELDEQTKTLLINLSNFTGIPYEDLIDTLSIEGSIYPQTLQELANLNLETTPEEAEQRAVNQKDFKVILSSKFTSSSKFYQLVIISHFSKLLNLNIDCQTLLNSKTIHHILLAHIFEPYVVKSIIKNLPDLERLSHEALDDLFMIFACLLEETVKPEHLLKNLIYLAKHYTENIQLFKDIYKYIGKQESNPKIAGLINILIDSESQPLITAERLDIEELAQPIEVATIIASFQKNQNPLLEASREAVTDAEKDKANKLIAKANTAQNARSDVCIRELIQNGRDASKNDVIISIDTTEMDGALRVSISDNGEGMDKQDIYNLLLQPHKRDRAKLLNPESIGGFGWGFWTVFGQSEYVELVSVKNKLQTRMRLVPKRNKEGKIIGVSITHQDEQILQNETSNGTTVHAQILNIGIPPTIQAQLVGNAVDLYAKPLVDEQTKIIFNKGHVEPLEVLADLGEVNWKSKPIGIKITNRKNDSFSRVTQNKLHLGNPEDGGFDLLKYIPKPLRELMQNAGWNLQIDLPRNILPSRDRGTLTLNATEIRLLRKIVAAKILQHIVEEYCLGKIHIPFLPGDSLYSLDYQTTQYATTYRQKMKQLFATGVTERSLSQFEDLFTFPNLSEVDFLQQMGSSDFLFHILMQTPRTNGLTMAQIREKLISQSTQPNLATQLNISPEIVIESSLVARSWQMTKQSSFEQDNTYPDHIELFKKIAQITNIPNPPLEIRIADATAEVTVWQTQIGSYISPCNKVLEADFWQRSGRILLGMPINRDTLSRDSSQWTPQDIEHLIDLGVHEIVHVLEIFIQTNQVKYLDKILNYLSIPANTSLPKDQDDQRRLATLKQMAGLSSLNQGDYIPTHVGHDSVFNLLYKAIIKIIATENTTSLSFQKTA